VLPNPHDTPADSPKFGTVATVSSDIPGNFGIPVPAARAWPPVAFGAAMPKATIHKHSKPTVSESKVGFAGKVENLETPSRNAGGDEQGTEFSFCRASILAVDRCHNAGTFMLADRIHRRASD